MLFYIQTMEMKVNFKKGKKKDIVKNDTKYETYLKIINIMVN